MAYIDKQETLSSTEGVAIKSLFIGFSLGYGIPSVAAGLLGWQLARAAQNFIKSKPLSEERSLVKSVLELWFEGKYLAELGKRMVWEGV